MTASKKTDNHDPSGKLALRKYFLEKYHAGGTARVFDCCQGGGVMWNTIRKTHSVNSYWGVDVKKKKGRLKIDSVRVVQQHGMAEDVIDVDTYGSPWKHWIALIPNIKRPTTVFLTIGALKMVGGFQGKPPREMSAVLNLPPSTPPSLSANLWVMATESLLAYALASCTIVECVEAVSTGSARYLGVRLEPKKQADAANIGPRTH